jgi:hypothetical protein
VDKRSCRSPSDCLAVGGGPCVAASPELAFKQQVSLVDDRGGFGEVGTTVDRAVVHAQIAGTSVWQKLAPFENVHDARGTTTFSNCMFDPIDDGNDEDSRFGPTDLVPFGPSDRVGPSSTCSPEFVFAYLGDTDQPFDPANIGRASDGPGLPGRLGVGTWVESRFDLSRFRGRSVKIRFLITSLKVSTVQDWQALTHWNPAPFDDGWYVDDIRVTQTLGTTSPTVTLDTTDNGALQPGNADGDARGDACDCAPADPGAFAVPGEVGGLAVSSDKVTLAWQSAAPSAGVSTVHDVLRGALAGLPIGAGPETCVAPGVADATATDTTTPTTGAGFWYVVRGQNACAAGSYGFRSDGVERMSSTCP